MLDNAVLDRCAAFSMDGIRHVIESFGPREPGGEGETRAQAHFAGLLKPWADEIRTEPFAVRPPALMGFMPVAGALFFAAILAYWLFPALALLFTAGALLVVVLQFVLYRQFLDPLFPARVSHNVVATRRAAGERKRRIIVSGHADAAYEWTFSYYGGVGLLKLAIVSMLLAGVFKVGLDVACVLLNGPLAAPRGIWRALGYAQWACAPFFAGMCFFSNFRRVVPGANDNLTGAFAAVSVLKYLHETNTRFEHTEVSCVITGSEEAGLRGAKAYARAHGEELRGGENAFLALETFRDLKHMAVYRRDMSGVVRNDARVCALLQRAGRECGLDLPLATIYLGSSDAAAVSQAGVPAAALAAMDPAPPRYYHTRLDDADNLDRECIAQAVRVSVAAVEQFDREGLQQAR